MEKTQPRMLNPEDKELVEKTVSGKINQLNGLVMIVVLIVISLSKNKMEALLAPIYIVICYLWIIWPLRSLPIRVSFWGPKKGEPRYIVFSWLENIVAVLQLFGGLILVVWLYGAK